MLYEVITKDLLKPGTLLIYYKGKMTNRIFASSRKSKEPHYFATAKVGEVLPDRDSSKKALFALIEDYDDFDAAVLAKDNGHYLETIPASRESNYWRTGVREVSKADYDGILSRAVQSPKASTIKDAPGPDFT